MKSLFYFSLSAVIWVILLSPPEMLGNSVGKFYRAYIEALTTPTEE